MSSPLHGLYTARSHLSGSEGLSWADYFSRNIKIVSVTNTMSKQVINKLVRWGIWLVLVSDNGTQVTATRGRIFPYQTEGSFPL
ncbi:hypothetical protein GOODEAATRI_022005 [Goodea atripinnis]|uniref:Uncharacterized protein n=1 Tax=Goodea atripinnis TaxID=208336 RepID=A0ABV0P6V0_9TELE